MISASHLDWYSVRASGYTALILLTVSMALGLLLSLRVGSRRWPRFLTNELHAFTTLVSLVFIGVHVATTIADPYIHFGLAGALVPFASGYRTWGMAVGIVATYLMIAVWVSSKLQRQIGWRTWRALHYAVFAVYVLAVAHTIMTGEDATSSWGRWTTIASVSIVGALTAVRAVDRREAPVRRPAQDPG